MVPRIMWFFFSFIYLFPHIFHWLYQKMSRTKGIEPRVLNPRMWFWFFPAWDSHPLSPIPSFWYLKWKLQARTFPGSSWFEGFCFSVFSPSLVQFHSRCFYSVFYVFSHHGLLPSSKRFHSSGIFFRVNKVIWL